MKRSSDAINVAGSAFYKWKWSLLLYRLKAVAHHRVTILNGNFSLKKCNRNFRNQRKLILVNDISMIGPCRSNFVIRVLHVDKLETRIILNKLKFFIR